MKFRSILQQYWGYDDFRGIQRDIIESIAQGRDTLGLMPTGGGKSITFQVPALAMVGVCLVISPLISLMKDQVANLRRRGIRALAVYTGMDAEEIRITLDNAVYGNFKFLYVSPERLGSELFQSKLRQMHVSFITVDEAHCISQWGYDFRPAYTQIAQVREIVPHAPVLALTATATPEVVADIQRQLHFRKENVCQMSFARANLIYIVRHTEDAVENEVLELLHLIPGPAIIYTRSRRKTEELSAWLQTEGYAATYYHAGLSDMEKNRRQEAFQSSELQIVVATNAFGMGIDKADVRLVLHVDIPDSPEAYFQEAGRAGRDGAKAYAVLLCNNRSAGLLHRHIDEAYPPLEYIRQVYENLCCFLEIGIGEGGQVTKEFDLNQFCINFRHYATRAYNAIILLSRAGFIEWIDAEDSQSRVMFLVERDQLYNMPLSRDEDRLVYFLLRTYTGLFSEYAYLDENLAAERLGLQPRQISELLIALSRSHIIKYIPKKYIPRIYFTQRRVDIDEITLPPSVYEQRRQQMERRVETMTQYIETEDCHSVFLLRYFGQADAEACGQCDNCLGDDFSFRAVDPQRTVKLHEQIVDILRHNGPTYIPDIRVDGASPNEISAMLRQMLDDEELRYEGDMPTVALWTD